MVNHKLYELTLSEECINMAFKYSLSKSTCQIASCLLFEDEIDFDLMRRALVLEYQRNDFLRLRFTSAKDPETGKKKAYQYFVSDMPEVPTPFVDFSGKTEEEMIAYLEKEASKPVRIMKGEALKIIFFRAYDGRFGIEFTISHLVADLFGIMNFYQDLLEVYKALRDGTDMPEPISGYEEGLERELKIKNSERNKKKTLEYANKVYSEKEPTAFAGIDGGRLLSAMRKKLRKPDYQYINQLVLFNSKAGLTGIDIEAEKVKNYMDFCEKEGISLFDLVYTGARTYLSLINGRQKKIMTQTLIHRRGTIPAKRHGGCYYGILPFVTEFDENVTLMEAMRSVGDTMMDTLRYSDSSYMKLLDHYYEIEHQKMGGSSCAFLMTVISPGLLKLPEGFNVELRGINTGVATYTAYFMTMPTLKDRGVRASFHYNKKMYTAEEAGQFLRGTYRAVDLIVENPDITLGCLLDNLQ